MSKKYIISIDRVTADELNQAHELIKGEANGWWHHHTNFWLVGGHSASFWRGLISPGLYSPGASVLVMKLPDTESERHWAFYGTRPKDKCKWFWRNYRDYK